MGLRADPVLVPRTGDAAIRLDGPSLAAHVSTRAQSGAIEHRWHEISIWEAESLGGSRYVAAVLYVSSWQGEHGHDTAAVILREELRAWLRAYDPIAHLAGYPPGAQWEARQARMRAELSAAWARAVSEVLDTMEVWEIPSEPYMGRNVSGRWTWRRHAWRRRGALQWLRHLIYPSWRKRSSACSAPSSSRSGSTCSLHCARLAGGSRRP